ncbi:host specificity protein J [Acinetobacter sp. Ver3]|uniref:host specificity protein J n=1 Tax=Acinetobacter sp. Ver3 TaxID=466088 RepID=UPI00044EA6D0|nr:phage tail protein [Acinetobacter sp. Ver3]EZQ10722.1 tail protein [Acinetobacter sp. Ver3]
MNAVIKGAKKGSGSARKPVIAPDSAQSKTFIKILYGLSEGEVQGLANGLKSIYLEETPLVDGNNNPNFQNVQADFRHGTNDQTYIEGFPDISSEQAIGVELKSATPWVRAISNTQLDAVRVRLKWGALRQTNADNGDVKGYTIRYAIDLQTGGGTWATVLDTQISDKTSSNYERSHRIDLPKSDTGWQIRVRKITPDAESEYISDKMYVEALTEVIDLKLSYPNTAMLGLQYDAETFSNVAKIAVDLKGVKIRVPSNYNEITRKYTGMWDGTFKRAYSNNPAWIYYDICTSKRYALGDRLTSLMIDKWSLYRLAQYCDQMVDDGKGGQEPRFTCNVYLQSTEDAYAILNKLAGVFRAITFWDGNSIVCDADIPQDTFFTYTRANVIDGLFEYSGSRARDRHTVAKVAWDNPKNHYKTEYVYVRDEAAIAKLGVRVVDIDAWGCTSEGQAQRAGLWALKSEQLETRTVSFKVGLDGHIPLPGKVIEIADELFAGRANGGRISAVSTNRRTITIDRDNVVCRAGDRLVVNGEDGKAQARTVSSVNGRNITVSSAFDSVAAQNVWVVDAQDLKTMKFRVMSITQNEKHQFSINAVQYEPSKYDAIDHGAFIDERPISIINPTTQEPVSSVVLTSENMVQQGISVATMLISWDQAQGATKYQVEWRKDNGAWNKLPLTGSNSVEVQGIYSGNYEARVTAISAFDVSSLPTYSVLTNLEGKTGTPPALANIQATGILFGFKVNWSFPSQGALDSAYTEIQIATTANGANAAQLGLFAYPTDTHVIQGMQPNLTRYFRGRLIDRIGNVGPWSQYASATTSADASAVLDILSGQLSESHLSQGLIEKIENSDLENNQAFIDVQQKIEGLDAQYYLRIQSGKYVSGFGLGVEGGRSDFIVHSDSFALGNPAGGDEGVSYPFIFRSTPYTDPNTGTVFPVGAYMKSAFMDYASIDTAHIKELAVKSAQIDDLAVTTAKIGDLQVDTLKIADNAVTVPAATRLSSPIQRNSTRQPTTYGGGVTSLIDSSQYFGDILSLTLNRNGGKCRIEGSIWMDKIYGTLYTSSGSTIPKEEQYVGVLVFKNGDLLSWARVPTSFKDTNQVREHSGLASIPVVIDDAGVGLATYSIRLGVTSDRTNSGTQMSVFSEPPTIISATLAVMELKK